MSVAEGLTSTVKIMASGAANVDSRPVAWSNTAIEMPMYVSITRRQIIADEHGKIKDHCKAVNPSIKRTRQGILALIIAFVCVNMDFIV